MPCKCSGTGGAEFVLRDQGRVFESSLPCAELYQITRQPTRRQKNGEVRSFVALREDVV